MIRKPVGAIIGLLMLVIFLGACAPRERRFPATISTPFPHDFLESGADASWWACRFKISWPPGAEVDWAVDLLLAHAVVGPVLREQAGKLSWWRFHRRAAYDETGHQFSFLFYANSSLSAGVMEAIRESRVLQEALANRVVEKIVFDDPNEPRHPEIEALSDPRWTRELQRHWPSYIMGVSSLWLGLIDDFVEDAPARHDNFFELLETYRRAKEAITTIWQEEGQHAFLHHLNAIFGYEALTIRNRITF